MALTGDRQEQTGGDHSTNLQAGRDLVHISGVDAAQARDIAQSVFLENFPTLRGIAEDVARSRASQITETFVRRLELRQGQTFDALADPDVLNTLYNGQEAFALSGEPDLEQVLVDLMADRADQSQRSLEALVLNEAVSVAGKLTEAQRRAVALVFLVRYTQPTPPPTTVEQLIGEHLEPNIEPFREAASLSRADCQHIEFVGVGSIGAFEMTFGAAIRNVAPLAFMRGVDPQRLRSSVLNEYEGSLWEVSQDGSQARFLQTLDQVLELTRQISDERTVSGTRQLYRDALVKEDEVGAQLSASAGWIGETLEAWNSGSLKMVTLTSVGFAIGHAYWKRVTGVRDPLSIWLS